MAFSDSPGLGGNVGAQVADNVAERLGGIRRYRNGFRRLLDRSRFIRIRHHWRIAGRNRRIRQGLRV
jgi:hypothetical protein